jgi:uroporphyrinogen decarboxylase
MTGRERVLAAINREKPDKAPKDISFTPALYETFREKTGSNDIRAYFGLECKGVNPRTVATNDADFAAYMEGLPADTQVSSDYGLMSRPVGFYHFLKFIHPLRNAETLDDIDAYPWPDFTDECRYSHLKDEIKEAHDQGFFVPSFAGHTFETAWELLGFEKWFEDILCNPDIPDAVLERITVDNCMMARRVAEAGADMLTLGDDVGMQDRLMMKPEIWRKYLKPRLARIIQAARDVVPNMPVWYHSDGNISDIIDDLIEVGVTVLNPVQPECLDLKWVKDRYADKLAFWGTIGTQSTMPWGTPDDVRNTVKDMIELFGPGLLLAPTHVLEPEVPWENVLAFFDGIEKYGNYH